MTNSQLIENIVSKNVSVKKRTIVADTGELTLLFVPQLTDRDKVSDYVIRPITNYVMGGGKNIDIRLLTTNLLQCDDMEVSDSLDKLEDDVLDGHTALVLDNCEQYISMNMKTVEKKSIDSPQINYSLRGPKDSFNENMDTNLSLIRYRIKDNNLRTDSFKVGKRTKTNVAMLYLKDVVNDKFIKEISEKINSINVDGIVESGELQAFLTGGKWSIFPQMGIVERSDMACGAILEGKLVILVEGSSLALVTPKTFAEFLASEDDAYDNKFFGLYSKFFRYISIVATLVLTPLYIAVVSFNTEILSADYTVTLASLRASVPFNAFTETLFVVCITELIRESLLRVPKEIGSAIGTVAAVIIGQSAVSAGIFSPLILIIATLSLLTSFIAPDYTIVNPLRILEMFLIIITGIFGFLGFTMGLFIILTKLASSTSLGVPFLAPHTPFNLPDTLKSFYYNKSDCVKRPNFLHTKDEIRGVKN